MVVWLVVQMVLTGFGTTRKKGGAEEPPPLPLLPSHKNTPT
jgi:hypothetical protein